MKQENNGGGVVVTFILILLIIAVFAGLIYVSYRIVNSDTTPENVATNEVLEENVENKIENKVENKTENVVEDELDIETEDEELTDEEIIENAEEPMNLRVMRKVVNDNGIIETQSQPVKEIFAKNRMIYNFNYSLYNAEFIYPAEWEEETQVIENTPGITVCKEKVSSGDRLMAVITEIELEGNNPSEMNLLEDKLKEYADTLNENVYSLENYERTILYDGQKQSEVLEYEYIAGKTKQFCYSLPIMGNKCMYVFTFVIPESRIGDETIQIKDEMLKTFEVVN